MLCEECKEINIIKEPDMGQYTSFKAGGRAALLVMPENQEELRRVLEYLSGEELPFMILGNGSNLLVRDGGYEGAMIKLGDGFRKIETNQETGLLTAGANVSMSQVARAAIDAGLAGFEPLSGIPGTLGGALFMNAGAYDGEMSFVVREALVMDRNGGDPRIVPKEEMALAYRRSAFQESGDVILQVTLQLSPGDSKEIEEMVMEFTRKRNEKQPMNYPSCGSFFKRPEGYFAGKLITDAGLKGLKLGGAQVSSLHAGFLINTGDATAEDVLLLMKVVQRTVVDRFGVELEPEVRIIGKE